MKKNKYLLFSVLALYLGWGTYISFQEILFEDTGTGVCGVPEPVWAQEPCPFGMACECGWCAISPTFKPVYNYIVLPLNYGLYDQYDSQGIREPLLLTLFFGLAAYFAYKWYKEQ